MLDFSTHSKNSGVGFVSIWIGNDQQPWNILWSQIISAGGPSLGRKDKAVPSQGGRMGLALLCSSALLTLSLCQLRILPRFWVSETLACPAFSGP